MYHRYIGDKAFYRRVFGVAVPIIIQNGITNFVSLLDNIMVGQVGTVPMSGVSIVNGLLFVFNLCVFGASSGAGIFTAQFYGSKDDEGIRHTFRFKFLICIVISLVGAAIFLLGGSQSDWTLPHRRGRGRHRRRGVGSWPEIPGHHALGLFALRPDQHLFQHPPGDRGDLHPHAGRHCGGVRESGAELHPDLRQIRRAGTGRGGRGHRHGHLPVRGACHRGGVDPRPQGPQRLYRGRVPLHVHPRQATEIHHHQGYAPAGQRIPLVQRHGRPEPVLLHLRAGRGACNEHLQHPVQSGERRLSFHGQFRWHYHGADAGRGALGGGRAGHQPEAHRRCPLRRASCSAA